MNERITIGRAGCDHVITGDDYVTAVHAVVWTDATGTWVADLGSTNGTRIIRAGNPVPTTSLGAALAGSEVTEATRINPGDTLIVGRTPVRWPIRREPIRVQAEVGEPLPRARGEHR